MVYLQHSEYCRLTDTDNVIPIYVYQAFKNIKGKGPLTNYVSLLFTESFWLCFFSCFNTLFIMLFVPRLHRIKDKKVIEKTYFNELKS